MKKVRWELPAAPTAVADLRRHAVAFATDAGASEKTVQLVALAVSEVATNAVLHAYAGREPGPVILRCRTDGERLVVEVVDEGRGISARDDSPGLGHGLATVGAIVQALTVEANPEGRGTVVTMIFGPDEPVPEVPGLEPLCALAVETVADASCLDVVNGGVLRRAAAEVAGDPELTEWLCGAVPPAKPGTATWEAMRAGGAHLVVHDPTVPRSPGGTGERLDLCWWVSVPLEGAEGAPAALWGLGGRRGGRPVPAAAVIQAIAEAAREDLAQAAQRAALRERLT